MRKVYKELGIKAFHHFSDRIFNTMPDAWHFQALESSRLLKTRSHGLIWEVDTVLSFRFWRQSFTFLVAGYRIKLSEVRPRQEMMYVPV